MTSDILNEIINLKKEKNAVILAHYYAPDEIQSVADYVGDSFYLARLAENIPEDLIVFCGVGFMAESVKIINPEKTVLVPDISADCAMAHMASVEKIKKLRKEYDDLAVVCYINSTADLKCHSDICVTSSNAVKIVKNLPNKNIFFIPDKNLGGYVAEQVPEKNIILNDGYCPIHAALTVDDLKKTIEEHPMAKVLTHPECEREILELSDYIGSTADILKYASESEYGEFIICTEDGVGYPLKKNNPDKKFYFAGEQFKCMDMKLNTPEKLLHVLKTGENEIKVSKTKREKALLPLKRMLESAK
ncbi:MAG: quinolinate synthase NadA [Clostridia bacterium]|nr:quinolinate synthase NadA [Clostridia bacterium]